MSWIQVEIEDSGKEGREKNGQPHREAWYGEGLSST
jgi:hypothetical protein